MNVGANAGGKKIAVVLSGCGFLDGTEITEAVSALIAISEAGAQFMCFAPDMQTPVAPHFRADHDTHIKSESRNALNEAARIARGQIAALGELRATDFDAVVFPGGYGAAKVLSNWAEQGASTKLQPDIERVLREFRRADKPIGVICIAPTLVAKTFGPEHVNVTIGNDADTAKEIEKTGAQHVLCPVDDYVSDRDFKVLSTPAYMYEATPFQVFTGIRKMIRELVEMA
ncbi:MAG: isoprenoid biosynthesis glyoxalase ElbB [Bdellovibrionaceae bacterium]|nr:isoprenoid biosynthesis glyoxalase ElbB [Pseudobdellovibrionaceae bacterium]